MWRSPVNNPERLMWENRSVKFARVILGKGESTNGETPLHRAARSGNLERVNMLLDRGANINAKDRFGQTPLHYAARSSVEVVRVLIARNAYIHVRDNRGSTPLSTAITKNDLEIAEEILKQFRKFNNCGKPDLKTLLCEAAEWSTVDMVALLLKNNTEVFRENHHEESPLHCAAKHGQHEIIKMLMNIGANINMPDRMGKTVLHAVIQSAHLDDSSVYRPYLYTVETILSYRPDIRNEMNRLTLSEAITNHWKRKCKRNCLLIPIVDALLRYGLTVRSEDARNTLFVFESIRHGSVKIIDAVLNLGIDVNTMYKLRNGEIAEMTLLHMAVECDQYEVAEFLVRKGADAELEDSNGCGSIWFAIGKRRETIAKMLMSTSTMSAEHAAKYLRYAVTRFCPSVVRMTLDTYAQIDVNGANDVDGITALHLAVVMKCTPDFLPVTAELEVEDTHRLEKAQLSIVETLLSAGASINLKTANGRTALFDAVSRRNTHIVQELLNHGADVNCRENGGMTPIYEAARIGDCPIVEILLGSSADVNSKLPSGKAVIHVACESVTNVVLVRSLCLAGCDVNAKDGKGATALHYATLCGESTVVRTLIENGANVNAKNIFGRTPLHLAAFYSWPTVAKILLESGADTLARSNDDKLPIAYAQHDDLDLEHQHTRGMIQEDLPDMELDEENYNLHVSAYECCCDRQCRGKVLKLIEKFQLEAERMKNVEIGQRSVTFHDILVCSKKKLLHYARSQCIVDAFESQISEFPRHRGIVQRRFQEAVKKNSQLTQTLTSLDKLTGNVFPPEIREMFAVFLNDQDMKNVKIASDLPPA